MRGCAARRRPFAFGALVGVLIGPTMPVWAASWPISLNGSSTAQAESDTPPPAPATVTATCSSSTSNTIVVAWTGIAHASTYSVYEATSAASGPYTLVASGVVPTSWTSGGLSSGNYWFESTASEGSNWQSATSGATVESTVTKQGNNRTCAQP